MKLNNIYNELFLNKVAVESKDPSLSEQMEYGERIEQEHNPTIDMITESLRETGKLPARPAIHRSIAKDHLNEFDNYYLPGLKHMEEELKADKQPQKPLNDERKFYLLKSIATKKIKNDEDFHNVTKKLNVDNSKAESSMYQELGKMLKNVKNEKTAAVNLKAVGANIKSPMRYIKSLINQRRVMKGGNVAENLNKLKNLKAGDLFPASQLPK